MSGIPNHSLHSLITSTDTVRKSFIKTLFTVNSNDFSCVLLIGQASSAYNMIRIDYWRTGVLDPLDYCRTQSSPTLSAEVII